MAFGRDEDSGFDDQKEEVRSGEPLSLSWQVGSQLQAIRSSNNIENKGALVDDLESLLIGKLDAEYNKSIKIIVSNYNHAIMKIENEESEEQRWSPNSLPGMRISMKYDSAKSNIYRKYVGDKFRALMNLIFRQKMFPPDDVRGGPAAKARR